VRAKWGWVFIWRDTGASARAPARAAAKRRPPGRGEVKAKAQSYRGFRGGMLEAFPLAIRVTADQ
jgi:hypothetical protein